MMYSQPSPESDEDRFFQGSTASLNSSISDEGRMRRKLRFFFMNPCQKFRAKRRVPFKLIVQFVKVFLVTAQIMLFARDAERHSNFYEKNLITFHHLYLKDWDTTLEVMPYPPTRGPFAIYTHKGLHESVDFLLERYSETLKLALGSYDFAGHPTPPVKMCRSFFKVGEIYARNQSYNFTDEVSHDCHDLRDLNGSLSTNFEAFLHQRNLSINFDRLLKLELKFDLKSVSLRSIDWDQEPDCYLFRVSVFFDNVAHNGEVGISLKATMHQLSPCKGHVNFRAPGHSIRIVLSFFDLVVITVCVLSLSLCVRSLHNALHVRVLTVAFFKSHHSHNLCQKDRMSFLDPWLIVIIISDILVSVGSLMKLLNDNSVTADYSAGGVLMGIGVGLVWFGLLRYLAYFGRYNILLRVVSIAMPSLLRFCVCTLVLFTAFTLCGWTVIGPYHVKFKSIESTAACLFSLLNGDDMYVTFSGVPKSRSLFCYCFNYIYLIVFISLFIYAVLNVFITIIIDAYDVMKEGRNEPENKTYMQSFMASSADVDRTYLYRTDEEGEGCNMARLCSDLCLKIFCCCTHGTLEEEGGLTQEDEELLRREGIEPKEENLLPYPQSGDDENPRCLNERTPLLQNSEDHGTRPV